jgi:hypothetical protein
VLFPGKRINKLLLRRCGGAEVRRCGGAEVRRCGGAEVRRCGGEKVEKEALTKGRSYVDGSCPKYSSRVLGRITEVLEDGLDEHWILPIVRLGVEDGSPRELLLKKTVQKEQS